VGQEDCGCDFGSREYSKDVSGDIPRNERGTIGNVVDGDGYDVVVMIMKQLLELIRIAMRSMSLWEDGKAAYAIPLMYVRVLACVSNWYFVEARSFAVKVLARPTVSSQPPVLRQPCRAPRLPLSNRNHRFLWHVGF
jgi:hypothetical protein